MQIADSLKLLSIVCVFDQAIYSKALQVKWKEKAKFKNCVLMMGAFHMLMVFMHILSKRFGDAGLRDALIKSSAIAEGSVDRATDGRMYNRGVRLYKNMYEALMRILINKMESEQEYTSFADQLTNIDLSCTIYKRCLHGGKTTMLYLNLSGH